MNAIPNWCLPLNWACSDYRQLSEDRKLEFSVTIINGSKLRATNARRSAPGDQIAMTKKKSEKPPRKRRSPAHRKIEKHFDQDLFTMLTRRRINIRLLSVWDNKRDNDRSI